jgi:phosphatidylglycerophosphatase A
MKRPIGLAISRPAALVATGLGVGLLPGMPGTWASLAALLSGWVIGSRSSMTGLGIAAVILFAAGWWASARMTRASGIADPGYIVIDEIAAQFLVLTVTPRDWRFYVAAFLLFRLFDIWKPFPVNWLDRNVHGGLGIMLDDVMAAIYAAALIALGEGVLGVRP